MRDDLGQVVRRHVVAIPTGIPAVPLTRQARLAARRRLLLAAVVVGTKSTVSLSMEGHDRHRGLVSQGSCTVSGQSFAAEGPSHVAVDQRDRIAHGCAIRTRAS